MLIVDMLTLALANEPMIHANCKSTSRYIDASDQMGTMTVAAASLANTSGGGLGQKPSDFGHFECEARSSRDNVAAVAATAVAVACEVRQQCLLLEDGGGAGEGGGGGGGGGTKEACHSARARAEYTGNGSDNNCNNTGDKGSSVTEVATKCEYAQLERESREKSNGKTRA